MVLQLADMVRCSAMADLQVFQHTSPVRTLTHCVHFPKYMGHAWCNFLKHVTSWKCQRIYTTVHKGNHISESTSRNTQGQIISIHHHCEDIWYQPIQGLTTRLLLVLICRLTAFTSRFRVNTRVLVFRGGGEQKCYYVGVCFWSFRSISKDWYLVTLSLPPPCCVCAPGHRGPPWLWAMLLTAKGEFSSKESPRWRDSASPKAQQVLQPSFMVVIQLEQLCHLFTHPESESSSIVRIDLKLIKNPAPSSTQGLF